MHQTPAGEPDLELILPLANREEDVPELLAHAAGCLLRLAVPAAIAVVDGGSSDRTLEAVDEIAGRSPVPIRTLGCSRVGWAAAALRGVTTSEARGVVLGPPGSFDADTAPLLDHAFRLLHRGVHVVCLAPHGRRCTVLDASVAELIVGEQAPQGPDFVPQLPDTARHAGVRMAAYGCVAQAAGVHAGATVLLERVSL